MLCKRVPVLLVLTLTIVTARTRLLSQDRPDIQYWPEFQVEHRLTEKVRFVGLVNPRFAEDISRLSTLKLAGSIGFQASDHFSLASFVYQYVKWPQPGRRGYETRLGGDAAFSFQKAAWRLQERNRVEVRDVDHRWSWRYRQQFQLSHPSPWKNLNLYTSYEFFYDSQGNVWRQNRLQMGAVRRWKRYSLDVYFLSNDSHVSKKDDFYVIGSAVRFIL